MSVFTTVSFGGQSALTAEPTEVAAGSGFGKTIIKWETVGETEEARSFVIKENGSLSQIGKGNAGEIRENFIRIGLMNIVCIRQRVWIRRWRL